MKKLLCLALLLASTMAVAQNATVDGYLKNVGTGNPTNSFVRFQLANCSGGNPVLASGLGAVTGMTWDIRSDSTGHVHGQVIGNDAINCQGTANYNNYNVSLYNGNSQVGPTTCYRILSGTTFNPGNPPIACIPVPTPAPPSQLTYIYANPPGAQSISNGLQLLGIVTAASFNSEINPLLYQGADIGAQINAAQAGSCVGGGNCLVKIPSGTFTWTTTVNHAAGVTIECEGLGATVLNYTGSSYASQAINATRTRWKDCEFTLGNSAQGFETVTGAEYHIWDNLLGYGGAAGSTIYRITGTRTNFTNLDFFMNVKHRNFNGAFVWADHALDLFLINDDVYGATNNLTSQAVILDSEVSGINSTNFVSGYSGAHALVIQNTFNNTPLAANASSGSSVTLTVGNSGVCVPNQSIEVWDGTNNDRPTISSIPDGTHIVVSTLAHSYSDTNTTISCGFAPNDLQSDRYVADTVTGGDAVYMSGSLNHGAGSTAFAFGYTKTWAAGAGVDGNGVCQTPGANGFYIRGGTAITIVAGQIRSNCGNGVLVDRQSVADVNLVISSNEIYDNGQSADNAYDGIQVTQGNTGMNFSLNRIGSLNCGSIRPRYGINITSTGNHDVIHSLNDLHCNRTGSIVDATADTASVSSIGNVNHTQQDLLENFANPLGPTTYIGDTNWYLKLNSGNPEQVYEPNSSENFDRGAHQWFLTVGGISSVLYANAGGAGTSGGFAASGNIVATGTMNSQSRAVPTQSATTQVVNTLVCVKTVSSTGPVYGYCSSAPTGGPPQTCTCN